MTTVAGTDIPVSVLHRLALGVEPIDALTSRPSTAGLIVEREPQLPPSRWRRRLTDPLEPWPPGFPLDGAQGGRYRLRHGAGVGAEVTIRLWDRTMRHVARRFKVPLWTMPEILAAEEAGSDVRVTSRLLRPWLQPGTGARLPRTTTGLRGRVERGGGRVPWARLVALDAGGTALARAAADERGEFLLVVSGTGTLPSPAPSTLVVQLLISADPQVGPVADVSRRFEVLPLEPITRSVNPPRPNDLDNPVLRGWTDPPGFVPSTILHTVRLDIGRVLDAPDPYEFTPQMEEAEHG